jgi:hypothetical protein
MTGHSSKGHIPQQGKPCSNPSLNDWVTGGVGTKGSPCVEDDWVTGGVGTKGSPCVEDVLRFLNKKLNHIPAGTCSAETNLSLLDLLSQIY